MNNIGYNTVEPRYSDSFRQQAKSHYIEDFRTYGRPCKGKVWIFHRYFQDPHIDSKERQLAMPAKAW